MLSFGMQKKMARKTQPISTLYSECTETDEVFPDLKTMAI